MKKFTFHKFTFPSQLICYQSLTRPFKPTTCKMPISHFPLTPSIGPSEALWPPNEGIEKQLKPSQTAPFFRIFVRLTTLFTSFRPPICPPSRPPFSGPLENTPCKTHRHLCNSAHPLIQFAMPPFTFQSFPSQFRPIFLTKFGRLRLFLIIRRMFPDYSPYLVKNIIRARINKGESVLSLSPYHFICTVVSRRS